MNVTDAQQKITDSYQYEDYPIFMTPDDEYIGLGHQPKELFLQQCKELARKLGRTPPSQYRTVQAVHHIQIKYLENNEGYEEFDFADLTDPEGFSVTYLTPEVHS